VKEARGDAGEGAARVGVGDMDRARDLRLRPRDDGDGARRDGGGDKVLAIDARAGKSAEDRARRDLAMIDGKPRHDGIGVPQIPVR